MKLNWKQSENDYPIWTIESPIDSENDKPLLRVEYMFFKKTTPYYIIDIMGFRQRRVSAENNDEAKKIAEGMFMQLINTLQALIVVKNQNP